MPDDLHKNGDFNDGATINNLCNNGGADDF